MASPASADVAISYLPDEETDAREVVALIQDAGRKAIALPGGRAGQPAELAPLFVALASSENSYSTAQVYGATGRRISVSSFTFERFAGNESNFRDRAAL